MLKLFKRAGLYSFLAFTTLAQGANQLCPHNIELPHFENAQAVSGIEKAVVVRGKKQKLTIQPEQLKDLISDSSYEGKYFKIVRAKEEKAIAFDADPTLQLKAATVYFHLTKARQFLLDNLGVSDFEQKNGQLTIRLDIENKFHRSFHYIHESNAQVYNNATSITCGKPLTLDVNGTSQSIPGWGPEIWFRPSKKIKIEKKREIIKESMNELYPAHSYLDKNTLIYISMTAAKDNSIDVAWDSLKQMGINAGTEFAVRKIVTEFVILSSPSHYYFESALIPEVIYHEFAHLFLGDHLPPTVNNPLIEGFCDYFSARISNSPVLAKKLGDYGKMVTGRDGNSKAPYKLSLDTSTDGLGSDYVLSLFWQIHEKLNDDHQADPEIEKKFFELRKELNTGSNIRDDLPKALLKNFSEEKRTLIPLLLQRGL